MRFPERSGAVLLGTAVVLTAAVLIQAPGDLAWLGVAGLVSGIFGMTVPLGVLVFAWASMLPIWSVGPLAPEIFDVARYGLGGIIAVRTWSTRQRPHVVLRSWALPLAIVAVLVSVLAWWHGGSLTFGVTMLASVVFGTAVLWRLPSVWPLFLGFAAGATISAGVLAASGLGFGAAEVLVPNEHPGIGRLTGLGTTATLVSVEFAIAFTVWWTALAGRVLPRMIGLIGMGMTGAALLLSGGRTGLLGLALASLLLVVRGWLSVRQALFLGLTMAMGGYWSYRRELSFSTLDRLADINLASGDIASGRVERLADAWDLFLQSPVLGSASTAHFAPLTFGLAGGIVGALIIVVLSVRLGLIAMAARGPSSPPVNRAGSLIAVVLTVTVVLETMGPFVGLEMVTLLLGAVVATRGAAGGVGASLLTSAQARKLENPYRTQQHRPNRSASYRLSRTFTTTGVEPDRPGANSVDGTIYGSKSR